MRLTHNDTVELVSLRLRLTNGVFRVSERKMHRLIIASGSANGYFIEPNDLGIPCSSDFRLLIFDLVIKLIGRKLNCEYFISDCIYGPGSVHIFASIM